MKYRLYIDEVGNADMNASADENHRYLNLTGIIIELGHIQTAIYPQMEAIKATFFGSHPDDPIVFHRRELVRRERPFQQLNDPKTRAEFDKAMLSHLRSWDYHVVSVTIDKLELQKRYQIWRYHPYHYCLHVILERYVMFLEDKETTGDVMAEARGGKEDQKLKDSFTRIFEHGTDYVTAERFQATLTSRQIKLKKKENNIAGLQLADLIAHPSHRSILATHQKQKQSADFGGQVVQILMESKYFRNPKTSNPDGWGRKWLP